MRTIVNVDLRVVLIGNWYWVVTRFPCTVVVWGISSGHLTICRKKFVLAVGNVSRRQYKCSVFKRPGVDTSSCRLCTRDIRQNACKSKCKWKCFARSIQVRTRPPQLQHALPRQRTRAFVAFCCGSAHNNVYTIRIFCIHFFLTLAPMFFSHIRFLLTQVCQRNVMSVIR
jgi:hypothetical protein